jgi:hypothetical protein
MYLGEMPRRLIAWIVTFGGCVLIEQAAGCWYDDSFRVALAKLVSRRVSGEPLHAASLRVRSLRWVRLIELGPGWSEGTPRHLSSNAFNLTVRATWSWLAKAPGDIRSQTEGVGRREGLKSRRDESSFGMHSLWCPSSSRRLP